MKIKPLGRLIMNKIKMFRESMKLSQEKMAQKLNISQQAYSNLENNPDIMTVQRLKKLSEILDVPASVLLDFDSIKGSFTNVIVPKEIQVNRLDFPEAKVYENHIRDLNEQIVFLSNLLNKMKH